MLLLSVIGREFRQAARKKRAHGLRLIFGVALAVWFWVVAFQNKLHGVEALGAAIYDAILMPLVYGLVLLGPALAAPSIAAERKADTLGLLFLTKLRPFQIVLAKFSARMVELVGFVLLVLPFLALPIWFGGVDRDTVINNALHLLGLLFLTTAIGLCVSAFFQNAVLAFIGALAFLFVLDLTLQFPAYLTGFQARTRIGAPFWDRARDSLLSSYEPFMGLFTTDELWFPGLFASDKPLAGLAVLICAVVVSALLLGVASWKVARISRQPSTPFRAGWRTRLLAANRIGNWLAAVGAVALAMAAAYGSLPHSSRSGNFYFYFGLTLASGVILLVLAAQSIASEKDEGTLEILVCTPLANSTIVNRKLAGVCRAFWGWYLLLNVPGLLWMVGWTLRDPIFIDMVGVTIFYLVSLPVLALSLGAFFSAYSKTTPRAIVASVAGALVLFQIWWLLLVIFDTLSLLGPLTEMGVALISFAPVWLVSGGLYLLLVKHFRSFAARR